jgi:3D (Asp-Asp-Asp) domain-containing protein
VGNHVAFASGEYKPGTLTGDALMAHELAHVQQQAGMDEVDHHSYNSLEKDADDKAIDVMTKMMTGKDQGLLKKRNKGLKTGLRLSRCGGSSDSGNSSKTNTAPSSTQSSSPMVVPPPSPTALDKPSELKYDLKGATKTKWRVDFDKQAEAQRKCDEVRKLHVQADDPEKKGKLWTFNYYPLTESEANEANKNKQKDLGDKYNVETKYDSNAKTFYLKISFKCPDAVPPKTGFEIWSTCYSDEKDAKKQVKKFNDAKIQAEVFELDKLLFSIYFKPYKTAKEAEDAGNAEAGKRGGFDEGMFTVTASENTDLKSFTYSTVTGCPAGYEDKGKFLITGYVLAQEKDFPATPTVKDPCGLTGTFSRPFLFQTDKNPTGVKMEGSGISKSGDVIQYEKKNGQDCFKIDSCAKVKGICLTSGVSVATDLSVIPRNSELLIEDIGARTAHDTGDRIKGKHIDVYYGTDKTKSEAINLTFKDRKVCKKK